MNEHEHERLIDTQEKALVVWAESECHPDPHADIPEGHECKIHLGVTIDPHMNPMTALKLLHEAAQVVGERYGITVLGGPLDPTATPRDNPFGIDLQKGMPP